MTSKPQPPATCRVAGYLKFTGNSSPAIQENTFFELTTYEIISSLLSCKECNDLYFTE